jgi:hypothetical protein
MSRILFNSYKEYVMVKGLREKTIELVQKEGQFDMTVYKPLKSCGTACCIAGNICIAAGLNLEDISYLDVGKTARELWAKEYGQEEAERLGFNEFEWGYNLHLVTPEQAIAHLNGEPSVWTGDENE